MSSRAKNELGEMGDFDDVVVEDRHMEVFEKRSVDPGHEVIQIIAVT